MKKNEFHIQNRLEILYQNYVATFLYELILTMLFYLKGRWCLHFCRFGRYDVDSNSIFAMCSPYLTSYLTSLLVFPTVHPSLTSYNLYLRIFYKSSISSKMSAPQPTVVQVYYVFCELVVLPTQVK